MKNDSKQCAQCKKAYRHAPSTDGCPKCAPGVSVSEEEFAQPLIAAPSAQADKLSSDLAARALDLLNQTQLALGRNLENHRNPSDKDTVNELLGLHDNANALRLRRELYQSSVAAAPQAPQPEAQPQKPGWKLAAFPVEWTPGPDWFKDWAANWFGPDADDDHLRRAVQELLAAAPSAQAEPRWVSVTEQAMQAAAKLSQAEPIAALVAESERLGLYDVPPLAELREKLGGWDVPEVSGKQAEQGGK